MIRFCLQEKQKKTLHDLNSIFPHLKQLIKLNFLICYLVQASISSIEIFSGDIDLENGTLKIGIYHAEIWAAPHQAVRGLPEDGALLRPREPQAGGPRPYPFEQHLGDGHPRSWEKPEELGALQRPEVHGEIVIGTQAMLVCTLAKEESQLEFVENFLVLL
ncbi:hypothetical protein Q9966_007272 [Columba livia]|nr:hypothetical protein Q9966_007272 [Columba livia]